MQLVNQQSSYHEYEWLDKFMREYAKEKKLEELPQGMAEPLKYMREMIELLPMKIAKLNAKV